MSDKRERSYCLIDTNAIKANALYLKSRLQEGVKFMCVVKANAYGHGAAQIARRLEDIADYFGVATADEGVELRKSGIKLPILVLGNTPPCDYGKLIEYDIDATVFSSESATLLDNYCKENNVKAKVHIAVDTGMGRIGFLDCEKERAYEVAIGKNFILKGLFTHFACADEDTRDYTEEQIKKFDKFVDFFKSKGLEIPIIHASNSAGILNFFRGYNMVRAGIALYGLDPSSKPAKQNALIPAMSWHTNVAHIKILKAGECVSYGRTYIAKQDRVIATLPIGYADGYPRILSSKAYVLIRGKRAPIVGRICMDQTMVDVTEIQGVSLYDDVVLMGKQGNEIISAELLGSCAQTINYEIVCSVSGRVKRYYSDVDNFY